MKKIKAVISLIKNIEKNPLKRNNRFMMYINIIKWHLLEKRKKFRWINATYLPVTKGSSSLSSSYYFGFAEPREMIFLLKLLRKEVLFIDVGANVGTYTTLASGVIVSNPGIRTGQRI